MTRHCPLRSSHVERGSTGPAGMLLGLLAVGLLKQVFMVSATVSKMGEISFECPDGFEVKGPDCFLLVDTAMKYYDAKETCELSYGAALVPIRDEVEAKEVGEMVHSLRPGWQLYWIGNGPTMHTGRGGEYRGMWDVGEPRVLPPNQTSLVAATAPLGRWRVQSQHATLPFVCRADACVQGTFRCRNGQRCLIGRWKCDAVYDCEDQSDEDDCADRCSHYTYQASGSVNGTGLQSPTGTCTWVIQGPPGQPLSINFTSLYTEEDVGYVEVWSGTPSPVTSRLQARLTGSLTNRLVYGYNNFLTVRVVANFTDDRTGFLASWEPDEELSHRQRHIVATDSWTELTSPHYYSSPLPSAYVRHYTVTTDVGSVITMEVLENDLMQDFEYDREQLNNINGEDIFPATYVSISNSFSFYLVSNGCERPEKFRARVRKSACGAGTFSAEGLGCAPCGLNTYQNRAGQDSCLPCPDKAFTNTTGATDQANCTRKCEEPNAMGRHCSGHGTCVFDDTAADGVRCVCDDNHTGSNCQARKDFPNDRAEVVGAIVGGVGAFLLALLPVAAVIAFVKGKGKKGGSLGSEPTSYSHPGAVEETPYYNLPLQHGRGVMPAVGRPDYSHFKPAADQDNLSAIDRDYTPPSSEGGRSYAGAWRDYETLRV